MSGLYQDPSAYKIPTERDGYLLPLKPSLFLSGGAIGP